MANNSQQDQAPTHIINSSRLDYLTLIEHGVRPPIAFKTKQDLDKWVRENCLEQIKLGRRDEKEDVVLVRGVVQAFGYPEGLSYAQVWVHAGYDYYRDAIDAYVKGLDKRKTTISAYDADHAVGRGRIVKHWKDAWINLLLVESGLNRSVGSMMEKLPLAVDVAQTCVPINAECILKAFYERTERLSVEKIGEYLAEASSRFLNYVDTSNLEQALDTFTMTANATEILNEISTEYDPSLEVRPPLGMLIIGSGEQANGKPM